MREAIDRELTLEAYQARAATLSAVALPGAAGDNRVLSQTVVIILAASPDDSRRSVRKGTVNQRPGGQKALISFNTIASTLHAFAQWIEPRPKLGSGWIALPGDFDFERTRGKEIGSNAVFAVDVAHTKRSSDTVAVSA
jgi:hypothetical protein